MATSLPKSLASRLVTAGRDTTPGAPLNRPIVPASNFLLGADRAYARDDGTPTWEALEAIVGALEDGQSLAFASGMAAAAAVFDQLHVGAHVVIPDDCYQGVTSLAKRGAAQGRWQLTRLALEDTAAWVAACAHADLLWIESPSNPLLTVADVRTIAAAPRKRGALLAVDNTFATALNQRPLDLGADISFQSATKFIGGHSDLLAGVLTVRAEGDSAQAESTAALYANLRHTRTLAGATPGALESYLAVRGARTMHLRLERAQANAAFLAERLSAHPKVTQTRYPGLSSHPTHPIARAQLAGFGTIVSFDVRGTAQDADSVCARVQLIRHATSLGAVESTMERRAAIPGQEHLPETLLRLSVGVEDGEEIWRDLEQALVRRDPHSRISTREAPFATSNNHPRQHTADAGSLLREHLYSCVHNLSAFFLFKTESGHGKLPVSNAPRKYAQIVNNQRLENRTAQYIVLKCDQQLVNP